MGKFLIGLVLGILVIPAAVASYLWLGLAPAAATAPPMPFERQIARAALRNRIRAEAPKLDVSGATTAQLIDGADVYKKNCSECHGNLAEPAPVIAKVMFPRAPQLMTPQGSVADDPAGVTYWKVENGIRLSGMPSFGKALTDTQKWDVTALLGHSDKLPPEVQDALKPAPEAPAAPAAAPATPPAKRKG
jgi:thiosulfate dehydrogenase